MAIPLIDNFVISVKKPTDSRRAVANATERNAIPTAYRWDGMDVFQRDDRKTYTWNDVTQSWSSVTDFSLGTGVLNSITFWNSTTTIGSSFMYLKPMTGGNGYIGINTNNPKSELQISSDGGGGVPMYFSSNSSGNAISDNFISGGAIDNTSRGSSNIYSNNGIVGISTRIPGGSTSLTDRLNIGYTDFNTYGVHGINSMVDLGTAPNAFIKLSTIRTLMGNAGFVSEFALRSSSGGNTWTTYLQHNGISIDASFLTPGTTRTFWERDPYNNFHYFGSAANYTLTVDGGNNRIGVNTKTPTQSIDVLGNYGAGNGPIINLENINTTYPSVIPSYGAGMICKNINTTSGVFIGQRPFTTVNDLEVFSVNMISTGATLLKLTKNGQIVLGNLTTVTNATRMVVTDSNNELYQQDIATMMSSSNYLVTSSSNGLMPKEYISILNRTRNIGYFGDVEIQVTTGTTGGNYTVYGDILVAKLESAGSQGNRILCTMRHPMDNLNYIVKMFHEARSTQPYLDNDVAVPVFVPVSTTQFRIYIQETAGDIQKIRIHVEVCQY